MPIYWDKGPDISEEMTLAIRCEFCKKFTTIKAKDLDSKKLVFCSANCKNKWHKELDRRERGY